METIVALIWVRGSTGIALEPSVMVKFYCGNTHETYIIYTTLWLNALQVSQNPFDIPIIYLISYLLKLSGDNESTTMSTNFKLDISRNIHKSYM